MADRSNAAVSVTIGAAFASGFGSVIGRANAQINRIGDAVKSLSEKGKTLEGLRAGEQRASEAVQSLTARLDRQREALQAAETRIEKLRTKIAEAGDPTGQLAVRLDSAEQAALRAKTGITALDQQLAKAKVEFAHASTKATEFARANKDVEKSLRRLGAAWQQVQTRRAAYESASAAVDRNRNERSRLRGEALENVAIIGGIYASMRPSIEFDYRLRLMANNADLTDKQLQVVRQRIRQIADETKQTDTAILDGLSSLIAAGMDFGTALNAMPSVAKAATTTGGAIAEFAQTADALNKSLKINPSDMLAALDALYKAGKEGKFEFRDMAQYFPALAAGMAKFGGRGVGAAAELAAAAQVARDVTGDASRAATLVDNFLTKLTAPQTLKRFESFGVDAETAMRLGMQRHADPFLLGLGLLRRAIGNDPLAIGRIFEDMEVQKMALALMQNTKRYRDVKAAALDAAGAIDRDFVKVAEELATKVKGLGNAWSRFFQSIAVASSGRLGAALDSLTRLAQTASDFASRNPRLVGAVMATIGALIGLKIATFGARYAFSVATEPFLLAGKAIRWIGLQASLARANVLLLGQAEGAAGAAGLAARIPVLGRLASMFGLVGAAAPAAAAGEAAVGAGGVVAAGGLGAAIAAAAPFLAIGAAVAAVGYVIWRNWQPLKAFFGGLWEGITQAMRPVGQALGQVFEPLRPAWNWLRGALSTIGGWLGSLFGQTKLSKEEFQALFTAGIWLGQKLGAVLGLVFTGIAAAIGSAIQSLVFLGRALRDIFTGNWGDLGAAWKDYTKSIQSTNAAIGGALKGVIAKPDATPAERAAAQRAAAQQEKGRPAPPVTVSVPPPRAAATAGITISAPITINAAAGQNPQDIARLVRNELERAMRDAYARRRSALHD